MHWSPVQGRQEARVDVGTVHVGCGDKVVTSPAGHWAAPSQKTGSSSRHLSRVSTDRLPAPAPSFILTTIATSRQ